MGLLFELCTFLWIVSDDSMLSAKARDIFVDHDNDVYLSVVSTWEISIKYALGKLSLPDDPIRYIPMIREKHGIHTMPLSEEATLHLPKLPDYHKDPFDRMLICQAIIDGMVILSPDDLIAQYPIRNVW